MAIVSQKKIEALLEVRKQCGITWVLCSITAKGQSFVLESSVNNLSSSGRVGKALLKQSKGFKSF